jgi:hypothetical protein
MTPAAFHPPTCIGFFQSHGPSPGGLCSPTGNNRHDVLIDVLKSASKPGNPNASLPMTEFPVHANDVHTRPQLHLLESLQTQNA